MREALEKCTQAKAQFDKLENPDNVPLRVIIFPFYEAGSLTSLLKARVNGGVRQNPHKTTETS